MDKMRSVCGQHCAAFQAFCIIHQMPSDPLNIWLLISSWLHKKKRRLFHPCITVDLAKYSVMIFIFVIVNTIFSQT